MARPNVTIIKGNGTLGGLERPEDGISLLVISAPAGYPLVRTGVSGLSLADFEAAGATQAADLAADALVWEHVKDFYALAPAGTELHVLLVDADTTFSNVFTPTDAEYATVRNYLSGQGGKIRLLGVALNPSFAEVVVNGISADLQAAVALAGTFAEAEFDKFRPVSIILEGRKFTGTAAAAFDLRGLSAGAVSVVIGRDELRKEALTTAGNSGAGNYAALGFVLGKVAGLPVQRNLGRVRDGNIGWLKAGLSGGQVITDQSDSTLEGLHDKGYIFALKHSGLNGFFFNDDNTAAPLTDDYCQISRNRVIDKACRIARVVYLEDLLDEIAVDPATGQLAPIVVKAFEARIKTAIEDRMVAAGECVSVDVTVDPAQNVLATGKVESLIQIIPFGIGRQIEATVQYLNPNNA